MQNIFRVIFFCFMIIGLSACATVTVEGDVPKTPDSATDTDTVHGSFYGFVWSEPPVTKCENGQGLARVRTHTNVAYSFVSILSLGLYVPQTITWWCDGTPEDDSGEEAWEPPE
jgi:hypothetical protein